MDQPSYVPPSAKALYDKRIKSWIIKYESWFENCPVGCSFQLPLDIGKYSSVRSTISRFLNKNDREFKVVEHENCYEVYRKA